MIVDNGYFEEEQKDNPFLKDFAFGGKSKTVTFFPKVYYQRKNTYVILQVEIVTKTFQEQLMNLEKKLEALLFCEVVKKELHNGYVEYGLIYNMLENRITIDDVNVENGCLRLMKNVVWEYDKMPHMLISGGTGGGKTYFILTLIEAFLKSNAIIEVFDPKNADLADLSAVMPNVYYKKEDILERIGLFYEDMMKRSAEMKQHSEYKTGENYAYLGLPAHFLIFDEYVAFVSSLNGKELMELQEKLIQIIMLGRQMGFFLIVACQRPDSKFFQDGIRDQFNFRVALGRVSDLGYGMMFGDVTKDFYLKDIKGRGYMDDSKGIITEFYTPIVPKGYDFMASIEHLISQRECKQEHDSGGACGA